MKSECFTASAPGRICLFGEHQDYLGLPVITAAVNLRIQIEGNVQDEPAVQLELPDIGRREHFAIDTPPAYRDERDYFKSAVNVVIRSVEHLPGFSGTVRGTIPINSGTSSSSALVIAWTALLLKLAGHARAADPFFVARLAHAAEVLEFNEPGGKMDHFASACGGVQFIEFEPEPNVTALPLPPGAFILGDSAEPKNTQAILSRVKNGALRGLQKISVAADSLDASILHAHRKLLMDNEFNVLRANLINRDLTRQARLVLTSKGDANVFGDLLTRHHRRLRDGLNISTPKIERMIDAALDAGALGAKINGSGGGGCMFAYTDGDPQPVADAIEQAGGKAYKLQIDRGVFVHQSGKELS